MFFVNTIPEYYLISADFEEYPELTLYEKEKLVIENFKKEILDYNQKEGTNPSLTCSNSNYYFVLWRNLPKTNISDNTEDYLFQEICRNILKYDNPVFTVNIKDINALADGSVEKFIKRLCLLKKYTQKKPVFLDGTDEALIAPSFESILPDELQKYMVQIAASNTEYDRIIEFLEKIYTSVTKESVDSEENGFIHYYFEWQKGNLSVEAACKELDGMSKRTFYKYVAEFEQYPLYSQFCKLHIDDLIKKEKKGPLIVDPEEFYKDAAPLFQGKEFDTISLDLLDTTSICTTYSLPSSLDTYRMFLAVKKKLKIK